MSEAWPAPPARLESARAPLAASCGAVCEACGRTLGGRQRVACSGGCRAVLARRRRDAGLREGLLRIRAEVDALLAALDARRRDAR
jgi:hypothetical protein